MLKSNGLICNYKIDIISIFIFLLTNGPYSSSSRTAKLVMTSKRYYTKYLPNLMSKLQNYTDPYKRHSNIDDTSNLVARNIHLQIKNPK
jgi:hypothetical protein